MLVDLFVFCILVLIFVLVHVVFLVGCCLCWFLFACFACCVCLFVIGVCLFCVWILVDFDCLLWSALVWLLLIAVGRWALVLWDLDFDVA